jgi:hypothetical protein
MRFRIRTCLVLLATIAIAALLLTEPHRNARRFKVAFESGDHDATHSLLANEFPVNITQWQMRNAQFHVIDPSWIQVLTGKRSVFIRVPEHYDCNSVAYDLDVEISFWDVVVVGLREPLVHPGMAWIW